MAVEKTRFGRREFVRSAMLSAAGITAHSVDAQTATPKPAPPSGIETSAPSAAHADPPAVAEFTPAPGSHYRLIQAVLRDQTDAHAELLAENEWLLHPNEADLRLAGNAFALENVIDGTGTIFLKLAPLPAIRPEPVTWDLRVARGASVFLNRSDGYPWASATYSGGKWGRIIALHRLQRTYRPYKPERDGLLLSNTWGDRNRDARVNPKFMLGEIEAGARLGVDIVQIDDGWQKGITANSASSKGNGVWNGFWATDPQFWDVNPTRFPDGLAPLIAVARAKGMRFGLWFAPDSSHDFQNWRRDADVIVRLHREQGVAFFKIDGVKIESKLGETNFIAFLDAVAHETTDGVTFDLDITAERRLGPFGHIAAGPLFVENRYTDWHGYWPHQTLRVAWQLAHWIDPVRLRMEWLNNARHPELYPHDPLAPAVWQPDVLFATVMFLSPLGWFEVQNLPPGYFAQAAPLIHTWKAHRAAIHNGDILPVGDAPDGVAWTGFFSINTNRNAGYALLFRELNASAYYELDVPLMTAKDGSCTVLGGAGTAHWAGGRLHVEIPQTLGFLWVKLN